ncbi:hypothetical protein DANISAUR_46 [Proteus phage vB_PmiS_DanisaurMW]|nr:hypothetical protein DANISAUR_46 [Proteus phage vB_PmiS_DanisaurMW]
MISAVVGSYMAIRSTTCAEYGQKNKVATEYSLYDGCVIKNSGHP